MGKGGEDERAVTPTLVQDSFQGSAENLSPKQQDTEENPDWVANSAPTNPALIVDFMPFFAEGVAKVGELDLAERAPDLSSARYGLAGQIEHIFFPGRDFTDPRLDSKAQDDLNDARGVGYAITPELIKLYQSREAQKIDLPLGHGKIKESLEEKFGANNPIVPVILNSLLQSSSQLPILFLLAPAIGVFFANFFQDGSFVRQGKQPFLGVNENGDIFLHQRNIFYFPDFENGGMADKGFAYVRVDFLPDGDSYRPQVTECRLEITDVDVATQIQDGVSRLSCVVADADIPNRLTVNPLSQIEIKVLGNDKLTALFFNNGQLDTDFLTLLCKNVYSAEEQFFSRYSKPDEKRDAVLDFIAFDHSETRHYAYEASESFESPENASEYYEVLTDQLSAIFYPRNTYPIDTTAWQGAQLAWKNLVDDETNTLCVSEDQKRAADAFFKKNVQQFSLKWSERIKKTLDSPEHRQQLHLIDQALQAFYDSLPQAFTSHFTAIEVKSWMLSQTGKDWEQKLSTQLSTLDGTMLSIGNNGRRENLFYFDTQKEALCYRTQGGGDLSGQASGGEEIAGSHCQYAVFTYLSRHQNENTHDFVKESRRFIRFSTDMPAADAKKIKLESALLDTFDTFVDKHIDDTEKRVEYRQQVARSECFSPINRGAFKCVGDGARVIETIALARRLSDRMKAYYTGARGILASRSIKRAQVLQELAQTVIDLSKSSVMTWQDCQAFVQAVDTARRSWRSLVGSSALVNALDTVIDGIDLNRHYAVRNYFSDTFAKKLGRVSNSVIKRFVQASKPAFRFNATPALPVSHEAMYNFLVKYQRRIASESTLSGVLKQVDRAHKQFDRWYVRAEENQKKSVISALWKNCAEQAIRIVSTRVGAIKNNISNAKTCLEAMEVLNGHAAFFERLQTHSWDGASLSKTALKEALEKGKHDLLQALFDKYPEGQVIPDFQSTVPFNAGLMTRIRHRKGFSQFVHYGKGFARGFFPTLYFPVQILGRAAYKGFKKMMEPNGAPFSIVPPPKRTTAKTPEFKQLPLTLTESIAQFKKSNKVFSRWEGLLGEGSSIAEEAQAFKKRFVNNFQSSMQKKIQESSIKNLEKAKFPSAFSANLEAAEAKVVQLKKALSSVSPQTQANDLDAMLVSAVVEGDLPIAEYSPLRKRLAVCEQHPSVNPRALEELTQNKKDFRDLINSLQSKKSPKITVRSTASNVLKIFQQVISEANQINQLNELAAYFIRYFGLLGFYPEAESRLPSPPAEVENFAVEGQGFSRKTIYRNFEEEHRKKTALSERYDEEKDERGISDKFQKAITQLVREKIIGPIKELMEKRVREIVLAGNQIETRHGAILRILSDTESASESASASESESESVTPASVTPFEPDVATATLATALPAPVHYYETYEAFQDGIKQVWTTNDNPNMAGIQFHDASRDDIDQFRAKLLEKEENGDQSVEKATLTQTLDKRAQTVGLQATRRRIGSKTESENARDYYAVFLDMARAIHAVEGNAGRQFSIDLNAIKISGNPGEEDPRLLQAACKRAFHEVFGNHCTILNDSASVESPASSANLSCGVFAQLPQGDPHSHSKNSLPTPVR